ncbi:MAG: hypothetical protein CME64_10390 [Halobacteriovoraceae bacterium]|nr:hypothetical protein [Halobacteriovoraceae bacterium]|tara:strand:+ start:9574 stop:9972 length:399 start_codon:yes stop_codon:yes gene_type:complete
MESVIRILILGLIFSMPIYAQEKTVGRLYFQEFMGHLHEEPVDSSASLTAIQCAHSLKVIEKKGVNVPLGWMLVKAGEDLGFVRSKFLGKSRPECFQEKYPKFYSKLNFDLADLYYWGRLNDHFIEGESQAR